MHGCYGSRYRNKEGGSLLDTAKAFDLVIANSSFQKIEEQLVIYHSVVGRATKTATFESMKSSRPKVGIRSCIDLQVEREEGP